MISLIENFYAPFSAWHDCAILAVIPDGVRRMYDYFTWPEIPPAPEKAKSKE
jgi:hypothetical protein